MIWSDGGIGTTVSLLLEPGEYTIIVGGSFGLSGTPAAVVTSVSAEVRDSIRARFWDTYVTLSRAELVESAFVIGPPFESGTFYDVACSCEFGRAFLGLSTLGQPGLQLGHTGTI